MTSEIGTLEPLPIPVDDVRAANRARFELELEFVQSLANPHYLYSLAQQSFFNQPAFVNYLKYLTYWKSKDHARFILYPQCLHHLDLLQHEQFRIEISKDGWREYLHRLQAEHWRTWRASVQTVSNAEDAPKEVPLDASQTATALIDASSLDAPEAA